MELAPRVQATTQAGITVMAAPEPILELPHSALPVSGQECTEPVVTPVQVFASRVQAIATTVIIVLAVPELTLELQYCVRHAALEHT